MYQGSLIKCAYLTLAPIYMFFLKLFVVSKLPVPSLAAFLLGKK
jgi:hypothetical protein